MTDIDEVLKQRGRRYGDFTDHAAISEDMQNVMMKTSGWSRLTSLHKEALRMIAHKIARILNGDPNYKDNWVDIAGYSKLVADRVEEDE